MPKFYITDMTDEAVVDAKTPLDACLKALRLMKFTSIIAGGYYRVNEAGFHSEYVEDTLISADIVYEKYTKKYLDGN